jgi:hypothetical protein
MRALLMNKQWSFTDKGIYEDPKSAQSSAPIGQLNAAYT